MALRRPTKKSSSKQAPILRSLLKPSEVEERQKRIEEGLPVSVNRFKAEPSAAGGVLRSVIASVPGRLFATATSGFRKPEEGEGPIQARKTKSKYLGDIQPIQASLAKGVKKGIEKAQETGKRGSAILPSLGGAIKSTGEAAALGVEGASYAVGGAGFSALKGAGLTTKEAIKRLALEEAKAGLMQEFGLTTAKSIEDETPLKEALPKIITNSVAGAASGAIGGPILGIAGSKLKRILGFAPEEIIKPEEVIDAVKKELTSTPDTPNVTTEATQDFVPTPKTGDIKIREAMTNLEKNYSKADVVQIMKQLFKKNPSGNFTTREIADVTSNFKPIKEFPGTVKIRRPRKKSGAPVKETPVSQPTAVQPTITPAITGDTPKSGVTTVNGIQYTPGEPVGTIPGTRTKPSGVSKAIEADLIEKGLRESGVGELAEYNPATFKEQSQIIETLVGSDYERAVRIASGEEAAPAGLRPEALFTILKNQATKEADAELAIKLARSPIASKISQAASELRLSGIERSQYTATDVIQDVIKKRQEAFAKKTGTSNVRVTQKQMVNDEFAKLQKSIERQPVDQRSLKQFINEIPNC